MNYDKALIKSVKGFMDEEEGRRLYDIAEAAAKMGACLEVGSYCGKSSIYIGSACKKHGGVLFSIDHHRGSEEQQPDQPYFNPELFDDREGMINTLTFFRKTIALANLEDTVVPVVSSSAVVAKFWATPLSLVFIDGGHTYKAAFTDYMCWATHIMPGGYLAVHDIFESSDDGGQAPWYVYEKAKQSGFFVELERTKTLGILRRRASLELPPDLPV